MPPKPKTKDAMTKHLTKAEGAAQAAAEASTLPDRSQVILKPPVALNGDAAARKYWKTILERMEGISILDDLDAEILGVYCSMLSRRDTTQKVYADLLKESKSSKLSAEERVEIIGKLDGVISKLQSHERTILQYADKLGLTPAGRVSLARKRAQQAAGEAEPDGDLFGD